MGKEKIDLNKPLETDSDTGIVLTDEEAKLRKARINSPMEEREQK